MKRIFSVFLALMLFCSMTVTAMAESFQISTDKNVISAGENVTVTVKLDKAMNGNYRNVQGQLKYDTATLAYVSHQMGDKYTHYASKNMPDRKYFTFSNTNMTAGGFTEIPQGTVATVVFKTNKDIAADHVTAALTLSMSIQDINGKSVKTDSAASLVICREHTWNKGEVVSGNACETTGEIKYTCTYAGCGAKKYETTAALGHDMVTDAAVAPTCTQTGLTEGRHCSRCSYKVAQETEPALGHSIVKDKAVAATCTEPGLTEGEHCSRCDYKAAQQTVAALGHDMAYKDKVEPTCTTVGHTSGGSCRRCDYTEPAKELPMTDHEMIYKDKVDATCTTAGRTSGGSCKNCSYTEPAKELPALGHDITQHAAKDPTCTDKGWQAYEDCSRCDYSTYKEITATGHSIVIDKAVAATCTAAGLTEGEHCSSCDYKVTQKTIAALGHDMEYTDKIDPTCTAEGYASGGECRRCGHAEGATVLPALGHAWNTEYTVDAAATTKLTGSKSLHCTVCDEINADSVIEIQKIKSAKVANLVYNGSNRTPAPTVLSSDGTKLVKGVDYNVTYKNAKATKTVKPKLVGKYTAVITFKGDYSGSVKAQFVINPAGTAIKKLTKGKKQFTATWTKKTAQVEGYQIRYGLKQNMNGAKTVNAAKAKTTKKIIKNLKSKKTYYVQIRTYKTVSGTKYFSAWSAKKTVKTK